MCSDFNYSVLMSVYEKEKAKNLKESIDSIFSQTVATNDFVLVCDGPLTAELNDVIEQYHLANKDNMQVVKLCENVGLGRALNIGLKYCKNELVARMDSDDISKLNRCEKQINLFKLYGDSLALVSGYINEFDKDPGNPIGQKRVPIHDRDIKKYSRRRNPINHPCVMFRKSAVMSVGGYQETFHLFEDYYLWIRLFDKGYKARNVDEVLLDMRTPVDLYKRRGGFKYAVELSRFFKWMKKISWINWSDILLSAVPHIFVCVLPNRIRKQIYMTIRK